MARLHLFFPPSEAALVAFLGIITARSDASHNLKLHMIANNEQEAHSPLKVPYILMMLFCIVNFDILRNLKESMLITRLGAEAIPFVKFWVVMPVAFCFLVIYSLLANRLNKRLLFSVTLIPFLVWMVLFCRYIFPNLDLFLANDLSIALKEWLPESLLVISGLVRYWPLTLFYAIAELWGAAVLCILFWTSVNDSFNTESARHFYPLLTVVGNSGSIFSGSLLIYCISVQENWEKSLSSVCLLFLIFGVLILGLNEYCHRVRLRIPSLTVSGQKKQTTTCLPFWQSARYLSASPYLGCIALTMLSYCISINLIEVAWKNQLVRVYPSEIDYARFMGRLTFCYGLGCLVCGILLSYFLRKGWKLAALATPVIMVATALPFFLISLANEYQIELLGFGYFNLLLAGVTIGMVGNVFSKSAKYTFFDTTKEMAFIPLNDEQKYKGKAAIELIASRLGKSGSSFILQFLILSFGSLSYALPWITGIFFLVIGLWFYSIHQLDKQYLNKISINSLKNKTS